MTDAAAWRAVAEVVLRSKSVLACARDPACSWDMVNDAVLSRGLGHLVGDERRFDGARMLGVDEHVWVPGGSMEVLPPETAVWLA